MSRQVELFINNYPVQVDLAQGRTVPNVACLGPAGTYTEAARYQLLGKYLDEGEMYGEFLEYNAAVVQRVKAKDFDLGIVPVENAIEGDVVEVLREINHAKHLHILGETILGIQHILMAQPGARIEEIHSHPQALAQSRGFLLKNYRGVKQVESRSTTAAAKLAAENKNIGAIASLRAVQLYGLSILAKDIGDIKGNSTRFLMLGKGEAEPTSQDSTALIFVPTGDRPGILARCLTTLASYGINLTKLDSRPTGKMREYAFWVTIDGHAKDQNVKRGLDDLRATYCSSFRILGSYRKAILPEGLIDPGAINGQERSNPVLAG